MKVGECQRVSLADAAFGISKTQQHKNSDAWARVFNIRINVSACPHHVVGYFREGTDFAVQGCKSFIDGDFLPILADKGERIERAKNARKGCSVCCYIRNANKLDGYW